MAKKVETALVVDEFEANALFWDNLLKESGLSSVILCRTGPESVEQLKQKRIDLIVANWNLTSTPGFVFVQKVRCNKRWRYIPLIVHAAKPSPDDFKLIQDLNLENFVQLPFDRPQMLDLAKRIITFEQNKPVPELLCRKIESLLNENRVKEAQDIFDMKLHNKGPWQIRAKILYAEIQLQLGQKDEAEETLKSACAMDEGYNPAKYAMAKLYSVTHRHDEALSILNSMHQNSPRNFATILNLSSAYIQSDQHENARKSLHKITILDPENREVDDELGKIALKEGDLALAAKFLAETQNGDEIARFYNSMGISLVSKGSFDKGIETYKSALQVLSSKAKLHLITYNLGLALRKKGDLQGSFRAFCESYLADPSFEKAYNSIAKTAQDIQKAGETLDKDAVKTVKEKRAEFQQALLAKQQKINQNKKSA